MPAGTPIPDLGRTFCDVVMKGGITSGVVYPTAVAGLADHYRLRSIGGASAGAIAAGAAAAAEYRRQRHGSKAGFETLRGLAGVLASPHPAEPRGPSLLFQLFRPTALSRPLFAVLTEALNQQTWGARIRLAVTALLRAYPGTLVLGVAALAVAALPLLAALLPAFGAALEGSDRPVLLAVFLALGVTPAFLAMVAAATAVVLGVTLARALGHLGRVMEEQDFGLCTGLRERPGPVPALTEWLHGLFQEIAGEPADRPLTFGDLRRLRFEETPGVDGIVLRVVTTCLTRGRPYTLPLGERLYFDPAELARTLPGEVLAWMEAHAWKPRDAEDRDADARAAANTVAGKPHPLRPIPEPDDFPVLLAVRMSLSFPILLSAIPLYRLAVRGVADGWAPWLERLVFTDGGVCSNLPIHLFDAPLPTWPTFALNLREDLPPGAPDVDRVVPPRRGRSYQWDRYDVPRAPGLRATGAFLGAIANTLLSWRDTLQRAAPGARERVFTIRHTADEGGLNLDMEREAIEAMARSGTRAAEAIREAFQAAPGTPPEEDDWQHHRWVRLRLLLPVLREFLRDVAAGTRTPAPPPSVEELLTARPPPLGRSHELDQASRTAAWEVVDALARASVELERGGPDFERTAPRPSGELRVTPTF
jgi:predicted acylesterase/phospholipase RssA